MVFAVWAGRAEFLTPDAAAAFQASYQWGRSHLEEMIEFACVERGFPKALARAYFTRHIVYSLSARHLEGLTLFRKLVLALDRGAHLSMQNSDFLETSKVESS
jgi:predicted solute-binding protein